MKDLNACTTRCEEMLRKINIPIGDNIIYRVNTRATKRWGQCKKTDSGFTIEISYSLLDDRNEDIALMNTVIHELLHTCDGCMNHKAKWQAYGRQVYHEYGIDIKRVCDGVKQGISKEVIDERFVSYTIQIHCTKCGKTFFRSRKTRLTKYPQFYRCGCGGSLVRI